MPRGSESATTATLQLTHLLHRWIEQQSTATPDGHITCPCCFSETQLLATMLNSLIRNLPLTCCVCGHAVLSHEIMSSCQKCLISSPFSVIDVAQESLDTPVQAIELQAAGNILGRYRHSNAGRTSLVVEEERYIIIDLLYVAWADQRHRQCCIRHTEQFLTELCCMTDSEGEGGRTVGRFGELNSNQESHKTLFNPLARKSAGLS